MNIREIVEFYARNGLFDSKYTYSDKIMHLEWFYQFDEVTIELINEYCAYRKLQGVKNSTINRELNLIKSAFNYYLKHKNLRAAYVENFWQVINWQFVSEKYADAVK